MQQQKYVGVVECEEGRGGCWNVVRWGSAWWWWLGVGGKLQLCRGAAVSLPARLALSSGQETATVSAVSLTANEFPGGGVVAVCVCVLMGAWTCGVVTTAWKKKGGKKNTATRMLWEPLHTRFQGHTTGRGAFTTLLWLPLPSCPVPSLLRSETTDSITDRGRGSHKLKGYCSILKLHSHSVFCN